MTTPGRMIIYTATCLFASLVFFFLQFITINYSYWSGPCPNIILHLFIIFKCTTPQQHTYSSDNCDRKCYRIVKTPVGYFCFVFPHIKDTLVIGNDQFLQELQKMIISYTLGNVYWKNNATTILKYKEWNIKHFLCVAIVTIICTRHGRN